MAEEDKRYWRRKLASFLHDPPEKALDIAGHENAAERYLHGAGFTEDGEDKVRFVNEVKECDIFDASAERFAFPERVCSHSFTENPVFIHPLSGKVAPIPPSVTAISGSIEEVLQTAIQGVETQDDHIRFFLYWRRWLENAVSSSKEGASVIPFLPADSRIPDHSIWAHMSMASAFVDCVSGDRGKMDLILFQFGPVQEFIAQARSTRDLWSGSYLLSWLMAHAIQAVTDKVGPDAVVSPSLRGNGIFDALHRSTVYADTWKGIGGKEETTWQRICEDKGDNLAAWLLTPTLPNRFFAIAPSGQGEALAKAAEEALRKELSAIAKSVWEWILKNGGKPEWKERFDTQVKAFPQITWAVQPWLRRDQILAEAEKTAPGTVKKIKAVLDFAENKLPADSHDKRYYGTDGKLSNEGIFWEAHYALLDAKLAARRNTRDFVQWEPVGDGAAVKDSLSGKEECIGDEAFWNHLYETKPKLFTTKSHRYGAMNLIKRLWCAVDEIKDLSHTLGLNDAEMKKALRYESVEDVAKADHDTYVAVLALDGDEMGKWISGDKMPPLLTHLAPEAEAYLEKAGGSGLQKLLTPSYHLQFSEALSAFAIFKAGKTVSNFKGELIYAGGDDILALVPAKQALDCAKALRAAFRVDFENGSMYPGSTCDMSCGIAVGHFKMPLQMMVKEAQKMEHKAKTEYGRSAVSIGLYKRSGEIIEWGTKWESNALGLMKEVTDLTSLGRLSGRFPYALAELLQPYGLKGSNPAMVPVIKAEVRHIISRQGQNLTKDSTFLQDIEKYLDEAETQKHLEDFINLFLAETFINRVRGEE